MKLYFEHGSRRAGAIWADKGESKPNAAEPWHITGGGTPVGDAAPPESEGVGNRGKAGGIRLRTRLDRYNMTSLQCHMTSHVTFKNITSDM